MSAITEKMGKKKDKTFDLFIMLTEEQLAQFHRDGCLAIENYLDADTVASLNKEIATLLNNIDLKSHPLTKFTTHEDEQHVGNDYFINSSDKIRFFFEVDAFEDGELTKPVPRAINKIGHGLHLHNQAFRNVTLTKDVADICRQLEFKDPRALQSMVIIKQPEIGGKVPSHQDGEFLYTEPQSCIGFWFALEKCTLSNGCLSFVPGSHKKNGIIRRFVKDFENGGTKFVDPVSLRDTTACFDPSDSDFVNVEIPAGTLVLIHNRVLHKSEKNLSQLSRNAYTFHVIDGTAKYDELNWLQMPPERPQGAANVPRVY
ncbi:hypothetical protein OGAPHI_001043 [Ogataea philodendri]|uniref:Phytanoyl-CoA dioxygenase n=1 Tax=Ogataea philodendri TaxID=1378263 RepID=A0A9P8PE12_9ASCO|nr:uncharacterized protein OGAPHI_001043 [Ogataea philodendri]KAH3670528.1 hypothetical protein OGAPHI_001043 [Ogataea philodendri]